MHAASTLEQVAGVVGIVVLELAVVALIGYAVWEFLTTLRRK